MKYTSVFRRVIVLLALLLVLAGSLGALYLIFGEMEAANRVKLLLEASKSLLYLITILLIGAFVAAMINSFDKNRQADRSLHDFRREFLDELENAYRKVKKTRRALRAVGLTTRFKANIVAMSIAQSEVYHKEMEGLNDSQLELERLKLEIGHFPDSFTANEEIQTSLEKMERYLGNVLTEYEERWPMLKTNSANVQFSLFKRLADFTGPYAGSSFQTEFAQEHDTALAKIRQELLPLRSVVKTENKAAANSLSSLPPS